jgi:hypothetical protein
MIKLNILSDNNKVPLCYEITNPKGNDSIHINTLIKKLNKKNINLHVKKYIIGDKGYCSKKINKKKYYNNGYTLIT